MQKSAENRPTENQSTRKRSARSQPSSSAMSQTLPPRINSGWWWVTAAGILFSLTSWIAFTQAPRPDLPVAPGSAWVSADWWLHPMERNAMRRLPSIRAGLSSIFSLPDGKHLWAVGMGGMIVYSQDGGTSWQRGLIVAPSAGQPPAATPGGNQQQENTSPKTASLLGIAEAVAGEPPHPADNQATGVRPAPRH